MALTKLQALLINNADTLVPHIEEAALKYVTEQYVMPARAYTVGDMSGWNVRKVSEYLRVRRAQELSEDTAIPDTAMQRVRKAEIEPSEWGDRHRISDRRTFTDLEDIMADTVQALGESLGDRKESELMQVALSTFRGGTIDKSGSVYNVAHAIDAQYEFAKRARRGRLFHVVHPFQVRDTMKDLVDYASGTNLDYRNQAISGWNLPAFGNLNVAVSSFLPRRILHRVDILGDGGTFRLQIGQSYEQGVNITADISVGVDDATTATNIENALNALTYPGSTGWTATDTGTAGQINVTPPAGLYLDSQSELRVAIDYYNNPTLETQKSYYDQITNPDGTATDENGESLGLVVRERSATAKSLLFFPQAMIHDVRQPIRSFMETVNQGRTVEISGYETYGVGGWRSELGMFIETDADSALAVG